MSDPFREAILAGDRIYYARMAMAVDLFRWQLAILESDRKRKVVDAARQSGKSSIVAPIATHTAKYKPGSLTIVQASTLQQASWDMSKIKGCISKDPTFPRRTRESDSLIECDNGSRIEVIPATEKSAQGASAPSVIILDEASDIEDEVISAGVIPMLTDNPECELILISTPHGRTGFFFRAFNSMQDNVPERRRWERFLIRSPFYPGSSTELRPWRSEKEWQEEQARRGVRAWFSPRHMNLEEQTHDQLLLIGQRLYLQEHCAEFIEPEEQVFSYDEIQAAFEDHDYTEVLETGVGESDVAALEEIK